MRMLPLLIAAACACACASEPGHEAPHPNTKEAAPADTAAHKAKTGKPATKPDPAAEGVNHSAPAKEPAHAEPEKKPAAAGHEEAAKNPGTKKSEGLEAPAKKTESHEEAAHKPAAEAKAEAAEPRETTAHEEGDPKEAGAERESGEQPALAPRPDTVFARAVDWEKGQAEIIAYAVKRTGIAGESRSQGRLVTERLFLHPDGTTSRRAGTAGETDILNATLSTMGEAGGIPFAIQTVSQLPRAGSFALLRQEQSLQGWPGVSHRSLDCRVTPPRMRIASSGGETPRDTVLSRWPVYTEEMLFTYLRALPLHAGYKEEVWLQDWGPEGRLALKPRYASISVRSRAPNIRDSDTWYVTVDRDDGRRSEFWLAAAGLHPVIVANLADGSEWTFQGSSRKAYWKW